MKIKVDMDKCTGCGTCKEACPKGHKSGRSMIKQGLPI